MKRKPSGPSSAQIGAALRQVIREAGCTQEDVAHAAGVPIRTFTRYLAGDSAMPASVMIATAAGLDISAGQLADRLVSALGPTDGRTDGRTDRPTDRPTDHSSRNARRRTSEGQLALSARPSDLADDELSAEELEALAKSEAARIIGHDQVNPTTVTKSKRRSAS